MCDEVTLCLQEYKLLFEGAGSNPGDKTLEDRFFEHEVRLGRLSVFRRVESQANLAKSETCAFTDRESLWYRSCTVVHESEDSLFLRVESMLDRCVETLIVLSPAE